MPFLVPGFTYVTGSQVTAANLTALVEDATPQDFNRNHFDANTRVLTSGPSETPSPLVGELYYSSANQSLATYNSTRFLRIHPFQEFEFTATSTMVVGEVVVQDTAADLSVKTEALANNPLVIGVCGEAVTSAPVVTRIATAGVVDVACDTVAVSVGDYLGTSGVTAGQATSVGASPTVGIFGRALEAKASGGAGTLVSCSMTTIGTADVKSYLQSTASFATSSMSSVSTLGSTWYDVPQTARGAVAPTTDGTDAMELDFTTTVTNALVFLHVQDLGIESTNATAPSNNNGIDGIRINLDDGTIVASWGTAGTTFPPETSGTQEVFGPVVWSYDGTSQDLAMRDFVIPYVVATAGAHNFRVQFHTQSDTTNRIHAKNFGATTLAAYEQYV